MASPSSPHFSPEPFTSLNSPDTLPCSDTYRLLPTKDLPATPSAYLSTSHAPESLLCHSEPLPCHPASGSSIELPTFSPVNESTFIGSLVTLQHLLIPSMLPMMKRYIGGQICLRLLLVKLERLLFPNWQECIKPLPRVLPWNPSL